MYLKENSKKMIKKFSNLIFKGKGPIVVISTLSLSLLFCVNQLKQEFVKSEASTFKEEVVVKNKEVKLENVSYNKKDTKDVKVKKEKLEEKLEDISNVKNKDSKSEISMPNFNNEFIDRLKNDTVAVCKDYGLYPSVMMAQAIIESDWGRSGLSVNANNFFGVKARQGQNYVVMATQEDDGKGNLYWIDDAFAKYDNLYESMEGNALVLYNNYNLYYGAFRKNTNSYADATYWLTGRYATDTNYYKTLNRVIEQYGLYQLDTINPE